jgi:threonine dehydratase
MADRSKCPPLTRRSVQDAHERIRRYIHKTPVLTSTTLNEIASTPQSLEALKGTPYEGRAPATPAFNLFFKCENFQKIGAFKARGAFHALSRLSEEERRNGVITHSSGNHAQALALAAKTHNVTAHIVMPTISTPSKIAGTRSLGAHVHFSGSTAPEREAMVAEVMKQHSGMVLVPPYDHPDIILGQGTQALELEQQVAQEYGQRLDAVIAPLGGGGMLSGIATALHGTGIKVFGAEPSFEGANDGEIGLRQGKRIEHVSTLTVADGLRTPVGELTWTVISDKNKVSGVFSVSEEQILAAMKLVLERMKLVVEPSGCVPLAVVLFNEDFRKLVERERPGEEWNLGVVFSGGNTTVEAIGRLFAVSEHVGERANGVLGGDGKAEAQDVAG